MKNRNPAITIANSWFRRARIRAPNLFGPGTWAHLYNNLWSDIDGRGLAVSCGAAAIAQGNVFQAAHNGLYNSDSGLPDWQFCAVGRFGTLYAPGGGAGAEANSLDSTSTQNLGGQPATGEGLTTPTLLAESDYELTAPIDSGTSTQTYRVTLAEDPEALADIVPSNAGVGQLF
jgi:pectate lyase